MRDEILDVVRLYSCKKFYEDSDYDLLWQRELKPMLETSLINRYLFERIGHAGLNITKWFYDPGGWVSLVEMEISNEGG